MNYNDLCNTPVGSNVLAGYGQISSQLPTYDYHRARQEQVAETKATILRSARAKKRYDRILDLIAAMDPEIVAKASRAVDTILALEESAGENA